MLISAFLRGTGKTYTRDEWIATLREAPFPGTKEVTSLTDEMNLPNYCFWNGSIAKETGFMLNSISESTKTGTVCFTVASKEAVGISATLKHNEKVYGEMYDLQGRKVVNPTKGLYIVNGKLFHRF